MTGPLERSPRDVVEELFRRQRASDDAAWTFIHIWRVADGMLVEHWACRDDLGLLEQLRPS